MKRETKDKRIILSARKDARKRLLEALEDFDPETDSEKIERIKAAVTQLDREIKTLEKEESGKSGLDSETSAPKAISKTGSSDSLKSSTISSQSRKITAAALSSSEQESRTIGEIDQARSALITEVAELKDSIISEREKWEEKLHKKQRELNAFKAKMNLRQAQLRADFQMKKNNLEKVRGELESRLRGGESPNRDFEEERQRWQARIQEKARVIGDLKSEAAAAQVSFKKQLAEKEDKLRVRIALLEEEKSSLLRAASSTEGQLRADISLGKRKIIELEQELRQAELTNKRDNASFDQELGFLKEKLVATNKSLLLEREVHEEKLRGELLDKEQIIRELSASKALLEERLKTNLEEYEAKYDRAVEVSEASQADKDALIKKLIGQVGELKLQIAGLRKEVSLRETELTKEKELQAVRFKNNLDNSNSKIEELLDKLSELKSEYEKDRLKLVAGHEKNIFEFQSQIAQLESERDNLSKAKSAGQVKIAEAVKEYDALIQNKEAALRESALKFAALSEQKLETEERLNDEVERADILINSLKQKIEMLEEDKKNLLDSRELIHEENRRRYTALENKYKSELTDLGQQKTRLEKELVLKDKDIENASRAFEDRYGKLEIELEHREKRIRQLKKILLGRKSKIKDLAEELRQVQGDSVKTNESLQKKISELNSLMLLKESVFSTEIGKMSLSLSTLEEEKRALEESYEEKLNSFRDKMEEARSSAAHLENSFSTEKESLLIKLKEADKRYEKLKQELSGALEHAKQIEAERSGLEKEVENVTNLYSSQVDIFNEKLSLQREKLDDDISRLKDEISSLKRENLKLVGDMSAHSSVSSEKILKREQSIELLKNELSEKEKEIFLMKESQMTVTKDLNKKLAEQRGHNRRLIKEKEQELAASREAAELSKISFEEKLRKLAVEKDVALTNLLNEKEIETEALNEKVSELELQLKTALEKSSSEIAKLQKEKETLAGIMQEDRETLINERRSAEKELGGRLNELTEKLNRKRWEVNKVREELESLLREFEERVAAQRVIWEEKLKNKVEQLKSLKAESERMKLSFEERLSEVKDSGWELQVQLEDDRKKWKNIFEEKETEYRSLRLEKEEKERALMEELARKESLWLKQKSDMQKELNRLEALIKTEIPRKESEVELLTKELEERKESFQEANIKSEEEIASLKEELKEKVSQMETRLKGLEEENFSVKSTLNEKESLLVTQKSRFESEISIMEEKFQAALGNLQEQISSLKTENADLKERLSKDREIIERERQNKKEDLAEIRKRLESNIDSFRLRLDMDSESSPETLSPKKEKETIAPDALALLEKELAEFKEETLAEIEKQKKALSKAKTNRQKAKIDEHISKLSAALAEKEKEITKYISEAEKE